MGAREEYSWLYDKLQIPAAGRRLVEHIRSSPPERATGGGRHNIHGHYPSMKMGFTIQFESNSCELAYVIQAEFNKSILSYYCQPYTLKHVYQTQSGKKAAHNETTDFLEISAEAISFVSCKKEDELIKLAAEHPGRYIRDEDGKWRSPSGEAATKEYGLGFKVVSSADFNPIFIRNLDFLADYLNDQVGPEAKSIEAITGFFADRSYGDLLALIEHVESADEVYRAIVTGLVFFEWESELIAQTHSAKVFRDSVSAKAYRCVMNHRYFDPAPQVESLNLRPGNILDWDGIPWSVLNVGQESVTLAHGKDIAPIPKRHFFELLEKGHIRGTEAYRDPRFDTAMERLLKASPLALAEADRRFEIIQPWLSEEPTDTKNQCAQTSPRTIREYLKDWKDGEAMYGDGYIGLIPDYPSRGNRDPKMPKLTLDLAKAVIQKHWLRKKAPTKQHVFGIFKKIARRLQRYICSDKTFYGLFKQVRIEDSTQARHGHKAAYQVAGPLWDEDTALFAKHGDRAFAVAHIDHTEIDLEFLSSVTRVNLGKAWLTLLVDAYTREPLGEYVSFSRPSSVSCMMAMRVCVARHGRLPDVVVSDQGKEFKGRWFRRMAARFRCTLKYRPAFEPRFGSILERAFGSLNTRLFHNLEGNTQNSKIPRQSASSHSPKSNAIWTLPKFIPFLERFLYEVLPNLDHFGLLRTPRSLFEESIALHGLRESRRIVYSEAFIFDTLPMPPGTKRKVHGRKGVCVNYLDYWSHELRDPKIINTRVPVKFDPFDAGHIWIFARKHWIRCECTSTLFRGIPIDEVMWAATQLKEDARRTGCRYRIGTQTLEDFFFALLRKENALFAEKRRVTHALSIAAKSAPDQTSKPDRIDPSPDQDLTESFPQRRPVKPLKAVKVKREVSAP